MNARSRAYRALLKLLPRDARDSFGADMETLFVAQRARVSGCAVVWFWLRVVADTIRHGIGERLERRTSRRRSNHDFQPRWWMDMFQHDLRQAFRLLFRQPGVSATILLTLALGIGANTAVFSVVNAVLLRPLPYPESDRLVMVGEKRPAEGRVNGPVAPADFLDWATIHASFTGMTGFTTTTVDLTGVADPVQLPAAVVSATFFDVFGIRALHGRTFVEGEDIIGRHRVAVLSHGLWQDRFGADPSVVGQSIIANGLPHEVIGVMPREFEFPGETPAMWFPLALRGGPEAPTRTFHNMSVFARLKQGVSLESARADMDRVGANLERTYPESNEGHGANVVSLREEIVGPARLGLLVVMAAVGFLLLIACTNVANVMLARAVSRRREMAIRSAVGAPRSRLLRQMVSESLVFAGLGGAAGLLVAWGTLRLLLSETPPLLRGAGLERAQLDLPVLLFTAGLCLLTGVIAGIVPAWHVTREKSGEALRETGRSPIALRRGLRFTLIATEVALTAMLVVGAGLMLRSFVRVLSQPPGIETANRLTLNVRLPRSRYADADAIRRARQSLDERLNAIPGVIAAGANNNLPLIGSDARQGVRIEGYERGEGDPPTRAHLRIVTPRYLAAAGIAVRAGRGFEATDDARAPLVVVINETMARRYWPGQSALGKRVAFVDPKEPWREVIGIIGDVKHWGLDVEVNPELYFPHDQMPSPSLSYVLHTAGDPMLVAGAVSEAIGAVDPLLPVTSVRTMENVAARSVGVRRWSALLLGMFATLGLVLAAAGVYGVMAHLVSMRTGEIGIRMTLGARPAGVLSQVLREALTHAAIGLAIGLVTAAVIMRGAQALLFEIDASDPLTFAATIATILAVSALAAIIPAVRAMRIDPLAALRAE